MAKSKEPPLILAFISIAAGVYPLLLSLDIILGGSASLNVPVWVGVLASSIFILAGLALLTRKIEWLSKLFGLSILVSFAVIGNWIAFGVGERTCSVEIFAFGQDTSGLMCRIPFGYGAILLNGIMLFMTLSFLAKKLGNELVSKIIGKINNGILLITLFPFLIFLVVPVIYGIVKDKLKS